MCAVLTKVSVPWRVHHPSSYVLDELIAELVSDGLEAVEVRRGEVPVPPAAAAVGDETDREYKGKQLMVVPMMGARFDVLQLVADSDAALAPLCWDVWEPMWNVWAKELARARPHVVFTTASQAATFLSEALPETNVFHCPEAARLSRYDGSVPLRSRAIGVLELGRRYEDLHTAITPSLQERGVTHLYRATDGSLIFPDQLTLARGLSQSAISICFPSSITHPERSGRVETLTHRYLESIASGCIVLGHAPIELIQLLGYSPVVEVDWTDPSGQILDILDNLDDWNDHTEEARLRLQSVGDWRSRIGLMKQLVRYI